MQISEKDLEIILQEGEGQTIEFKESFAPAISKKMMYNIKIVQVNRN